MKSRLSSSLFLLALTTSAFANAAPGQLYAGLFGGGGASNHFDGSQFGTAYFFEIQEGPFGVNAFGQIKSKSTYYLGAQLGYEAQARSLHSSAWSLAPAIELEGFTMNKRSLEGTLSNDNVVRLPEHDFNVTYPMNRTVFLANAVFNFSNPCLLVQPYIGFGIGSSIVTISNANSVQVNPPEVGFNHYNSKSSDTNATFAGQVKLGLSYDIIEFVSVFAEYRWLYLANTHYVFGSTVYPNNHVETSPWQVNLNAQRFNLGNIGVRLNW